MFEMKVYDDEFTIKRLVEDCKTSTSKASSQSDAKDDPYEIDLQKLRQRLAQLPVAEIRQRRKRMNIFYEEVLVSADPDRGISFNSLLMTLAHYKVINDNKSLR